MGSLDDPAAIIGEYRLPVIGPTTENSNPWTRNYFQPPDLGPFAPRNFPLKDIRPLLSQPGYSALDLLQSHGFGIVKHNSSALAAADLDGILAEKAIKEVYNPEIENLVLETLGAKKFFNLITVLRQGKTGPEEFKLPKGITKKGSTYEGTLDDTQDEVADETDEDIRREKMHMPSIARLEPTRLVHRDYTPLGARQTIRAQSREIRDVAEERGVICAEDRICEINSVDPVGREADAIVAEQYNRDGELGPRYAMYSIWRPLKKVGRDPITLAPRKESPEVCGDDLVNWPYLNRVPGFQGEWLKEFAMLGLRDEHASSETTKSTELEWFYISAHMPDEVLFIKLFDSASLGSESKHAGAPWHASPEIFDAAGSNQPRESIENRVIVFW